MTSDPFASVLQESHERFFASQPDDLEMRESFSLWFFDAEGRFGFPRIGIEREAGNWARPRIQCNLTGPGGLVMNGAGVGDALEFAADVNGPSAMGAGALTYECVEPFRRFRVRWGGPVRVGDYAAQIATKLEGAPEEQISWVIDLEAAAPVWVHDNRPEVVAEMSEEDAREAGAMGIGWRLEQLVRGRGEITFRGETHSFSGTGSRIKRQSVRPLDGFRGHCWQSGIFPDGRGFGYIAYPPRDDGSQFNDGYVTEDGKIYPARAVQIPWLRRIVEQGDDISCTLEYAGGTMAIKGRSAFSTYRVGNPDIGGLNLNQGGGIYTFDGMKTMGMIERSAHESLTEIFV